MKEFYDDDPFYVGTDADPREKSPTVLISRPEKVTAKTGDEIGVFRKNERVKVVGMSAGHGQPAGTILTVSGYIGQFVRVYENTMSYYDVDLQAAPYTMQDAQDRYDKAKEEFICAKARLDYMKETKLPDLSEAEFRCYMIKKVIASTATMDEKVESIVAIFKK